MDVATTEIPWLDWWRVVVPVKDARVGKSRLAATMSDADEHLRRAIADDTLHAVVGAVGVRRTILVTSDRTLASRWVGAGVTVVPDPGTGLNGAITAGLRVAEAEGRLVAALLGDLPALIPDDLLEALAAATTAGQSYVPDRAGTGTVLRCGPTFVPRFGPASAQAHEADGAARLDLDLPRLRTDVDDLASLTLAVQLGLGSRTQSALARPAVG